MNVPRLYPIFPFFASFICYKVVKPHVWLYTCVAAFLIKDFILHHSFLVEYFPFRRFTPYCWSDLYFLLIGSMDYLVPLFKVSFPIPNRSGRTSVGIFVCLSVEEKVCLVGRSYKASSNRVVCAIFRGSSVRICSLKSGSGLIRLINLVDTNKTLVGFNSFFPVRFSLGNSCRYFSIGDLVLKRTLVPALFNGMNIVS